MSDWTNEAVLEFIELYRIEAVLYDPNQPNHKNKRRHHEAWSRIRDAFRVDCGIEITIEDLKKKKESLMASFRQHMKRKRATIGAPPNEVYKPSWFAFEALEAFLGPLYGCDRALFNNTERTFDEDFDISTEEVQSSNFDCPSPITVEMDQIINTPLPTKKRRFEIQRSSENRNQRPERRFNRDIRIEMNPVKLERSGKRIEMNPEKLDRSGKRIEKVEFLDPQNEQYDQSNDLQIMDQAFEILQDLKRKEDDDDCDLYARLLANKLRKIPEADRSEVMYEIDGLVLTALKTKCRIKDNE